MKNKKVIISLGILVLLVGVFAILNGNTVRDKKEGYENSQILIKSHDQEVSFNLADIEQLGPEDFTAQLKSSGKPAEDHTYTGVPVKALFDQANIKLAEGQSVNIKAIDGYTVAVDSSEILDDDHIYLVYQMDGRGLGNDKDGGSGPYQVIMRKDEFGQRWSKHVVEIAINE